MSTSRGDWARWGLLTTTLVLGITLIATTWSSHRGIVRASAELARGHGENLIRSLRRDLGPVRQLPTSARLTELLEEHRSDGLFHLSIVDGQSRALVEVGEPWEVPAPSRAPDGRGDHGWRREGDRYQLVAPLDRPGRGPRGRPPRAGPGPRGGDRGIDDDRRPRGRDRDRDRDRDRPVRDPDGRRGPDLGPETDRDDRRGDPRRDDRPRRPPPPDRFLAIGFEASATTDLTRQTAGALALGTTSALLLMLAAVVFWRQTRARERARRQLEHQQRMSSLGEMSAVLAHEIRNPLASLKGHAQLLAEQLGEEVGEAPEGRKIQRIVGEATRLEKLTEDLLAFARSGALDRRPLDPRELAEECRREVSEERIDLDTEQAPPVWTLDRSRLHQVLTNLLRNALQASPEGARVDVRVDRRASPQGDTLRIRIRDRGEGLPEGHEDEIFEPFFTTRTRGVGLGLAVARRIVELHGGELVARNHPEGGAELEVRVPNPPDTRI